MGLGEQAHRAFMTSFWTYGEIWGGMGRGIGRTAFMTSFWTYGEIYWELCGDL